MEKEKEKAEIRVKLNPQLLESLKRDLHVESNAQVAREAFAVLMWAVKEAKEHRKVVSCNQDMNDVRQPIFEKVSNI